MDYKIQKVNQLWRDKNARGTGFDHTLSQVIRRGGICLIAPKTLLDFVRDFVWLDNVAHLFVSLQTSGTRD